MYADKSDKWHHTMARYLGLSPDTSVLFGILPALTTDLFTYGLSKGIIAASIIIYPLVFPEQP